MPWKSFSDLGCVYENLFTLNYCINIEVGSCTYLVKISDWTCKRKKRFTIDDQAIDRITPHAFNLEKWVKTKIVYLVWYLVKYAVIQRKKKAVS